MNPHEADPGEHLYLPKQAAPALKAAMADLARQSGRAEAEFDGMALGTAFDLACTVYGDNLPPFWKTWQTWNLASKRPPAPMGDL
jgi:hypothetical protein